ncbi:hypothetical protein ATANTOWER_024141 [Ataeniobius toweri]|uniref:Uncharacterized protein n=1 Tax=Ataeniobius toweri TaxID=208326 RepID=A0ABU7CLI1_9TELE|nr:hypothetical protein [Ataeniobius toweri]
MHIRDNLKIASDQLNRNKVPEWQRIAGKAAKEVEKFAKEKADLVLMHWRDKMGIAQKEVKISFLLLDDKCSFCLLDKSLLLLLTLFAKMLLPLLMWKAAAERRPKLIPAGSLHETSVHSSAGLGSAGITGNLSVDLNVLLKYVLSVRGITVKSFEIKFKCDSNVSNLLPCYLALICVIAGNEWVGGVIETGSYDFCYIVPVHLCVCGLNPFFFQVFYNNLTYFAPALCINGSKLLISTKYLIG